jgi:hypothetical protein
MVVRGVHFVGGYPGANTESAMRAMIDETGGRIDLVPSVEHAPATCSLRAAAAASSGLESTSAKEAHSRPAIPTPPGAVDYVAQAVGARAVLDRLEREYDQQFTLQLGLPHYIDTALASFGPDLTEIGGDLALVWVLADHLHRQIHAIIAAIGADTVLFQIDSRHALTASLRQALDGRGPTAEVHVGETVATLINRATPQVRFGVHLCPEDVSDKAIEPWLPRTAAIASAGEAIGDVLERPEALEYVHFPLAATSHPSRGEADSFRQLARLRRVLPDDTRLVAGLVDEGQAPADQAHVLDLVEAAVGEAVDISAPCGLGRCAPEAAKRLVGRMLELAAR